MLTYESVKDNPTRLLALTSLTQAEFEQLLPAFAHAWQADCERRAGQAGRQRRPGGGRKAKLNTLADKLFFILVYVKTYPLQAVMASLFGLSQGQVNVWIHRLTPLLQSALAEQAWLPERRPEHLAEHLAQAEVWTFGLDGSERRRQRPQDPEQQKDFYSGKKKAHTVKNLVIAELDSHRVVYLSQTVSGRVHDKRLCDAEGYTFPDLSQLFKDTGFQGYEPPGVLTFQPQKKPRSRQLTAAERFLNQIIASVRIEVEHVICGIKRCRIVKDTLRNTKALFADTVMAIACGLHNLRTGLRHPSATFDLIDMALAMGL